MPDLNGFYAFKSTSGNGADEGRGGTGGCFPAILLVIIAAAILIFIGSA